MKSKIQLSSAWAELGNNIVFFANKKHKIRLAGKKATRLLKMIRNVWHKIVENKNISTL